MTELANKPEVTPSKGRSALPLGWRWVRLGEVCKLNPQRPRGIPRDDDAPTTFVPMSAVDDRSGTIAAAELRPYGELKKGYTYFGEGDVLFAKITPCMQNGKHAIARGLTDGIGFGSTEFHVIRPGPEIVPEWVHFFIRQPSVLQAATAYFCGSVGQQRVPEEYLATQDIPLPPLAEQKRIAAILNEQMGAVERARAAAQARLEAVKALPAAYLRQVFPKPGTPLQPGWRWTELGDVCEFLDSKRIPVNETERAARIAGKPEEKLFPYYGANGQVGWIDGYLFDEPLILLAEDGGFFGSSERPIAYALQGKYWVNNHAHVLRPRPGVDFDYCLHSVTIRPDVGELVTGNTRPKLNQDVAARIPIPLAPLAEQQRIGASLNERMAVVERVRRAIEQELQTIEKLAAALLHEAFYGRL